MLYTTKLKPILSNPAKIFSFPLAISKQMCYNITVICTDCIIQRYFACGEYTLALRLTSELVDLRAGICEADSRAALLSHFSEGSA